MQKPTLFIIGGNSTAYSIRETVEISNHGIYDNIFNVVADGEKCDYPYITDSQLIDFIAKNKNIHYIIGFTNQKKREKFSKLFKEFNGTLVNIIHPKAFIFPSAKIGKGNYIACNVIISSKAIIGDNNLINYNVSIGHDTIVGDDCIFNPGARIGGCTKIGNRCLFGANSFVYQGIEIVSDCKFDALVYVKHDVKESITYRNKNRI